MAKQDQFRDRPDPDDDPIVAPQARALQLDDLLAEIDEVLETNAEDFVKAFVQKGGQ